MLNLDAVSKFRAIANTGFFGDGRTAQVDDRLLHPAQRTRRRSPRSRALTFRFATGAMRA